MTTKPTLDEIPTPLALSPVLITDAVQRHTSQLRDKIIYPLV
jgi:hypothetical protein